MNDEKYYCPKCKTVLAEPQEKAHKLPEIHILTEANMEGYRAQAR